MFYIKFKEEIKAKGSWVMKKCWEIKEEEGMDIQCDYVSHKL